MEPAGAQEAGWKGRLPLGMEFFEPKMGQSQNVFITYGTMLQLISLFGKSPGLSWRKTFEY